jgi:uncharacterized membrane protein YgcG
MLRHFGLFALALAIGWLVVVHQARAIYPPPVKDGGKFFSAKALEKANAKIKDLYKKYTKDVVVETLDALSADEAKKAKEDKEKFWENYARKRIDDLGVNGVYIVISKDPRHIRVERDPKTPQGVFKDADAKTAFNKFLARFKEKEFDEGLLDALDAIEAAMKANKKSK